MHEAVALVEIGQYMFLPDEPVDADLTIVLGMSLVHRPVARAIQLHAEQRAGMLIFSGGYNVKIGACEADQMLELWSAKGQPTEHVLLERTASNTMENMRAVKRVLMQANLLRSDMRVNLVTIAYHMRRALETFREVFGTEICVGTANYPSEYCPPDGWAQNDRGRALVLGEFEKIRRYLPARYEAWFESRSRGLVWSDK